MSRMVTTPYFFLLYDRIVSHTKQLVRRILYCVEIYMPMVQVLPYEYNNINLFCVRCWTGVSECVRACVCIGIWSLGSDVRSSFILVYQWLLYFVVVICELFGAINFINNLLLRLHDIFIIWLILDVFSAYEFFINKLIVIEIKDFHFFVCFCFLAITINYAHWKQKSRLMNCRFHLNGRMPSIRVPFLVDESVWVCGKMSSPTSLRVRIYE